MDRKTDTELVALVRSGSKDAFGYLIERYQQMAKRLALAMVSNKSIAKELVQQAMLQAYLSLDHLRDDVRFRSWLYGIVLNVCRSYIRNQKIDFFSWEAMMGGLRIDPVSLADLAPDPQALAEQRELHHLVLKAVNALSPKNRTATLLFYYDQLSLRELAATLDISVGAVKGRLHKSRKQLRGRLLPLYLEMNELEQRRKTMVKVTIADVIERKYKVKETEEEWTHVVVMLLDEANRRVLSISVGPFEGESIAVGIRRFPAQRPMTYDFMANILEAVGAELEEVRVETLKDEIFYGVAKLRNGDKVQEVDARPSDLIALAVRAESPIYVAEEILKEAGIDVSKEMEQEPQLGYNIDGIIEKWEREVCKMEKNLEAQTIEEKKQRTKRNHQELKSLMFGSES